MNQVITGRRSDFFCLKIKIDPATADRDISGNSVGAPLLGRVRWMSRRCRVQDPESLVNLRRVRSYGTQ